MSTEKILLTNFSKGSGCGCKIAPGILEKLLPDKKNDFPGLLVGFESRDDAAVFETESGNCIISTTDFFTPIVNDPYSFGRIAAANALSDVYAMGGKPVMALSILGWPIEKLSPEIAKLVIEGGRSICEEAGIPLAGGHSIDIPEPVFGLAVTGEVKKKHLKKNNTAKAGDIIFLTKPIGSGVLSSALKKGLLSDSQIENLIRHLSTLNSIGYNLGELEFVSAMTDVTGFGLIGHLLEMAEGSGLTANIEKKRVPKMEGFDEFVAQFVYPDNTTRNFTFCEQKTAGMHDLDFLVFCDPQTNGGLIFSSRDRESIKSLFHKLNLPVWEIGVFTDGSDKSAVLI
ncbi:MAG: selenide, water dikinase SelD [Bacteroidota bacterium]|jgi:selenide,water dikinase